MSFPLFLFYVFSFALVSSALIVVSTRNTVHSVMFLVLAFFNAAGLFVLLNAEFLAMLLIVVYVGAIAVLFLFVVMMLNVDEKKISDATKRHIPLLLIVGIIMFAEITLITQFSSTKIYDTKILFPINQEIGNTKALGNILYTDFILPFQLSGAILFVAMIGAIVLTLKDETRFIRKQKISDQTSRTKNNSLKIVQVKSGAGINQI